MKLRKLSMKELGRLTPSEFISTEKIPVDIVLDNVRSSHNVGSIFRTSDAYAIEKIHLCGFTPTPPSPDIHKAALGATDSVEWEHWKTTVECLKHLKSERKKIWAVEQTDHALELMSYVSKEPICLVFGNEVKGVSNEALGNCDGSIFLEQFGTKHSLNISVCAGIVIFKMHELMRIR